MWSRQLSQSYTSVESLSQAGLIAPAEAQRLAQLGERYQIRITPYYASLMTQALDCPIRLQAIPALAEEDPADLPSWATQWSRKLYGREVPWSSDPIGDVERLAAPRLTHRYGNRAILHLSTLCAVYCRFCFRKSHLNEREASLYDGSLEPAFEYLSSHPEVRELILTGGDPLSLTDAALTRILDRASQIASLKVVRIHSRMAVTLPGRLTPELASLLAQERSFSIHLVSHFNHPLEWTSEARSALRGLRRVGIPLFNQSVILKRVNDSAPVLAELFQGLYEAGVVPMYLHYPDWTPGTFHFRTGIARALEIARELAGQLPGAALPQLVLDLPCGLGKTSLTDGRTRRIEGPADRETRIQGGVYEVTTPLTRTGRGTPLYLDLYAR